jgi:cysteine desulfurase
MNSPVIYLDYNSTTPVDDRVVTEMLPFFTKYFGNASSKTHKYGWEAAEAVDIARNKVAGLISCNPEELIFTSGSTEAINIALKGIALNYGEKKNHIITCCTEHKAVLDTCRALESDGYLVSYLSVDREGKIDLNQLEELITANTLCVCLMLANNETGTIHPAREIGKLCHEKAVFFFTDATQAAGKLRIDVEEMQIDMLCLSAHKLYGPKGVGALYLRRKNPTVKPAPVLHGGGHERGLRPGTLNVAAIVGFGKAAELAVNALWDDAAAQSTMRTVFEQTLEKEISLSINGDMRSRLPNTTNISFKGIPASRLISALPELAFSTGSACTSALPEPSYVLKAMGLDNNQILSSARFSIGRTTSSEEIKASTEYIVHAIKKLMK